MGDRANFRWERGIEEKRKLLKREPVGWEEKEEVLKRGERGVK